MSNISNINSSTSTVDYGSIATGKRINSAADDASGLTISNKLESQANALTAGADNAETGKNVTNIADGALGGIQDYLQKIREVSVKAMNGLNSADDLSSMQKEIESYMGGIQQISQGTEYNTKKLLDGNMADMNIATNPDGSGMKIQMANSTLESLGIDGYDVTKKFDVSTIDSAINKVSDSRSSIGASANALDYASSYNSSAALEQTGAQSRIEDLDIPKAISEQKKNTVLEDYKNTMLKKQMDEESLVTKLLQ
jgi:flagellin